MLPAYTSRLVASCEHYSPQPLEHSADKQRYYIPWLAPLHPGRVITTFLGLDVLCEVVLGAGAPRISNDTLSKTEREVGWALIKAGMILQVILLISFLLLAAYFHYRCIRNGVGHRVKQVLPMLYAAGLLILERSIMRTAEMFEG